MKLFIVPFLILISNFVSSQSYAPFNDNVPKRFENTVNNLDNDYYFYAEHTLTSGDTTTHKQYLRKSNETVDVTNVYCQGWGGGLQQTADTTWLGREIKYNVSTKELWLFNDALDTLHFDFGLTLADSASFYESNTEAFYIRYDALMSENVLGSMELVKSFSIWKYDNLGNLLASTLNGFEIKISQNLGIVQFINCKDFPNVELSLELMGQLHPTLGYYQMTYEEVYPWDVGDTLEVVGRYLFMDLGATTKSYRVIAIQNRVETVDSVWIYLDVDTEIEHIPASATFPNSFNIGYLNPIIYRKNDNIIEYPNNATSEFGTTYSQGSSSFCGLREQMISTESWMMYCDSCDCFTPTDGFGSVVDIKTYTEGLGVTSYESTSYGANMFDAKNAELVYANIGGIQCGVFQAVGILEHNTYQNRRLIRIVDVLGRETLNKPNMVLIYIYDDGTTEKVFKFN